MVVYLQVGLMGQHAGCVVAKLELVHQPNMTQVQSLVTLRNVLKKQCPGVRRQVVCHVSASCVTQVSPLRVLCEGFNYEY